jgi:hypothetical protein
MDVYDCVKEVFYGNMTFKPDAPLDSKERTIKLPPGTEIDNVIATYFKKREAESEPEQKAQPVGDKIPDNDELNVLEKKQAMVKEQLKSKFKKHGRG